YLVFSVYAQIPDNTDQSKNTLYTVRKDGTQLKPVLSVEGHYPPMQFALTATLKHYWLTDRQLLFSPTNGTNGQETLSLLDVESGKVSPLATADSALGIDVSGRWLAFPSPDGNTLFIAKALAPLLYAPSVLLDLPS